jgi:RNA polymerase sigma-70 factor, ECF subfamily
VSPIEEASHVADASTSDAAVDQDDLRTRLEKALSRVSAVQREVVLLHDLEGLRHAEVADRLGISELMSRRHLSDARRALRKMLSDIPTLETDHD